MGSRPEQNNSKWCEVQRQGQKATVFLYGKWRLSVLDDVQAQVSLVQIQPRDHVILDGTNLEEVDTAGAMLLYRMLIARGVDSDDISVQNFHDEHLNIGVLVKERLEAFDTFYQGHELGIIEKIGKAALQVFDQIKAILIFLGETSIESFRALRNPRLIRIKEVFIQVERAFVDAVPVIAMVTFLIGVVVAYLFAIQIEKFGANIFVVDAVALAMCRELSPIVVAIIVAGRSGSAFTAHIGTMKLNEEIDAMTSLGLSPLQVLVLPRVIALILAMPMLTFIGDIVGIIGGMLIADERLGITGATFINRLQTVLPLRSFFVGMVKAPVFAVFIAVIGCLMGLTVENNARSIGLHTTSTVVQSIVSVIILNAIFAVIFVELGI